jgi:hypothetical protein
MIYWNVYYIPWNKMLTEDPARHVKWMIIMADNKGSAKEAGKKQGMVTEVTNLHKNRDTAF